LLYRHPRDFYKQPLYWDSVPVLPGQVPMLLYNRKQPVRKVPFPCFFRCAWPLMNSILVIRPLLFSFFIILLPLQICVCFINLLHNIFGVLAFVRIGVSVLVGMIFNRAHAIGFFKFVLRKLFV
jgi:hypothetical protein